VLLGRGGGPGCEQRAEAKRKEDTPHVQG
jgi:hypothetical protein